MTARYDVLIVGGFGHVGLPFGIALADAGFQVALYDRDPRSRPMIESGRLPFVEYDAEPRLRRTLGRTLHLAARTSPGEIRAPLGDYHALDVLTARTIVLTRDACDLLCAGPEARRAES